MSDSWLDEAAYDQDRLERHVWKLQRKGGFSRREVLAQIGALAAGVAAAGSFVAAPKRASAQDLPPVVKPTPPNLFRTLGTNRETLFEALKGTGYLTPASLFFIRNHTRTPRIDASTWRLRIEGSGVKRSLDIGYDELLSLRSVTKTRFIECAGNGRSFFDTQQGQRAAGTQWRLGAVGVAEWTGVPLSDVLARAGLLRSAVDVQPEGLDDPVGSDGHVRRPFPIQKALEDVLLVYGMNGELLPQDHGYPVRLLVPGWVGISNIKWVGRIEVSNDPLFSIWSTVQYRLIGDAYPDSPALTRQTLKSAFELPFPATLGAGWQILTGRSWSAHGRIQKVEVSFDDGATWQEARRFGANDPQAWTQWSVAWRAEAGNHVLRARATDTAGNVQSESVPFNTNGYVFSAVVRHPVTVV